MREEVTLIPLVLKAKVSVALLDKMLHTEEFEQQQLKTSYKSD